MEDHAEHHSDLLCGDSDPHWTGQVSLGGISVLLPNLPAHGPGETRNMYFLFHCVIIGNKTSMPPPMHVPQMARYIFFRF